MEDFGGMDSLREWRRRCGFAAEAKGGETEATADRIYVGVVRVTVVEMK
jgi:hypothetical protein